MLGCDAKGTASILNDRLAPIRNLLFRAMKAQVVLDQSGVPSEHVISSLCDATTVGSTGVATIS